MLPVLYEIRNNRNVGHVGGDVDPNHMDAVAVLSMSNWIMCELVRVYHDLDTATAQSVVDALVDVRISLVWSDGTKKRVLQASLSLPAPFADCHYAADCHRRSAFELVKSAQSDLLQSYLARIAQKEIDRV